MDTPGIRLEVFIRTRSPVFCHEQQIKRQLIFIYKAYRCNERRKATTDGPTRLSRAHCHTHTKASKKKIFRKFFYSLRRPPKDSEICYFFFQCHYFRCHASLDWGHHFVSRRNLNDPCLSGFLEGRRNGWKLEQNVAFPLTITNRSTKKYTIRSCVFSKRKASSWWLLLLQIWNHPIFLQRHHRSRATVHA